MNNWTRKDFIKTTLLGGAAIAAARPRLLAQGSTNGDIRIGVVGVGGQGSSHMRDYCGKLKGARVVAICDADADVLTKRAAECDKAGFKVATYADYRKMLENKDVDAIVIGTPNHQHSLQTIWALQAGKDVYVEKPLSHNVWEGRQAVEATKKYSKNIVQAGTQNRSSLDIMAAIADVRAGKYGKIQWVRGLCYKERQSIGKTTGPQAVPASVNYDFWTGPADLTPPRRNSAQRGPIHYDWHWFWNYGGGDITNQGIHQMDVARWFLGESGLPNSVMSFGGRFGYDDDAETPNTLVSVFNYAKAPLIFEVRGLPTKAGMRAMDAYRGGRVGVVVQCENGHLLISESGNVTAFDKNNERVKAYTEGGNGAHRANFVKAVQTRKVVNGLVLECHLSSALCHLGNLSYLVGAEKSNAQLAEAVKADVNTKDSFARMMDHLKANEVDTAKKGTVVGPLLKIDGKTEMFTGGEKTITTAANKHPLRMRVGRGDFKIPTLQGATVASS